jgi:hypothetical protein
VCAVQGHKELIRHLAKLSPLHAVVEDAPEGWVPSQLTAVSEPNNPMASDAARVM